MIPTTAIDDDENNKTTPVASLRAAPIMLLVLLQGLEDARTAVTQYQPSNTEPFQLGIGAHIRFFSQDYRTTESMKVVERNLETREIQVFHKSHDVNNEFFNNVGMRNNELQARARFFKNGTIVYDFDVKGSMWPLITILTTLCRLRWLGT